MRESEADEQRGGEEADGAAGKAALCKITCARCPLPCSRLRLSPGRLVPKLVTFPGTGKTVAVETLRPRTVSPTPVSRPVSPEPKSESQGIPHWMGGGFSSDGSFSSQDSPSLKWEHQRFGKVRDKEAEGKKQKTLLKLGVWKLKKKNTKKIIYSSKLTFLHEGKKITLTYVYIVSTCKMLQQ